MGEACLKFNTPVTGGNVSFYNQSPDGPVYPTPTIGMVGLLQSIDDKMTMNFKQEGDAIYLIGQSQNDINSSEYLHKIIGEEFSPCPYFNLDEEYNMQTAVAGLIKEKAIASAHDVSEGGLFVTLLESAFTNNLGFDVAQKDDTIRSDAFWFGEAQSRVVVSVNAATEESLLLSLKTAAVPYTKLGSVSVGYIKMGDQNWGDISSWKNKYDNVIGAMMSK